MFSSSTLIFNSDLGSSLNLSFNSGRAANASVCTSGSKLVLYQQTEEEKGGKREDPRKETLNMQTVKTENWNVCSEGGYVYILKLWKTFPKKYFTKVQTDLSVIK